MFENPLHFAVLALAQSDRQPDVVALFLVERGLDGAVEHTIDRNSVRERVELLLRDLAEGPHAVAPQPSGGRQLENTGQAAIVGQKQKTFGVDVETSDGKNPRQVARQLVEDRTAALRIPVRRHQSPGLVIKPQPRALTHRHRLAIDDHLIRIGHGDCGGLKKLAVQLDAAGSNPGFGITAGAKACACHDLGDTFALFQIKAAVGAVLWRRPSPRGGRFSGKRFAAGALGTAIVRGLGLEAPLGPVAGGLARTGATRPVVTFTVRTAAFGTFAEGTITAGAVSRPGAGKTLVLATARTGAAALLGRLF